MPNKIQIIDDLALVPLTASEVATLNLQSLGVVTITSGAGGSGDMSKSVFATLNPSAGFVDKAVTATNVPYSGLTLLPGGTTNFLRADGTFAAPPGQIYGTVAIGSPGLAPALPASSNTLYYLRGDGSWQLVSTLSIAYSQLSGIPPTFAPTAHAIQHITSGNDVIPLATTTKTGLVPLLPTANATISFHRGDNAWSIIPNVTSIASGHIPAFPGTTTTFFRGDGTYATVAYGGLSGIPATFAPTLHASSHVTGGSDVIPNFSIGGSASGLAPASPGGTVNFLRADGTWQAPPGGGGLATSAGAGLLSQLPASAQTTFYLRGDNSFQLISGLSIAFTQLSGVPVFAGGSAGLVPNSLGGSVNFLRADGIFAAPSGGALATSSAAGLVSQLPASAQTTFFLRGDNTWQLISTQSITYSQLTGVPTTFVPAAHATTHITGGTDVIPAPTTTKSGLVPVLPSSNPTLNFLRGDASFAVIPIATGSASGLVPAPPNSTSQWFRGDATFAAIPPATSLLPGLAPSFPGNTTTFLRGDGSYSTVSYASLSGTPASFSPSNHATTHITGGTDIIPSFTSTSSGLAPLSGGGSTTFLRADGTWQTPAGAGDVAHTRQILTVNSLTGGGDLSADRTHALVGDVASPGNFSIYSTNGSGVRGWNASTSFPASTNLVSGLVPTPPNNAAQFLSGVSTFLTPPNFTSIASGYAPLSGGGTTNFLRADGSWSVPATPGLANTSTAGIVPQLPATLGSTYFLRGDNSWQLLSGLTFAFTQISGVPIFSGTATPGLVPASDGNATKFLRGDGVFSAPPLAATSSAGFISGLPASQGTSFWARGDNSWQLLPDTILVSSPWNMPPVGSSVSGVLVNSTATVEAGMTVYTQASATLNSMMDIASIDSGTTLTLINRGYAPSPASGTSIPGGLMFIIGPGVAASAKAGFVPTPSGVATEFLSGVGTWLTPAGSGGGSGTVNTQFSVSGDGSVGNKVQLVNDASAPGNFKFYSTDSLGTRGWFPLTYSWETVASFPMPGVGATANISLVTNVGVTAGSTIVVEDNTIPPTQGFLEVVSVNGDLVHVVVRNPGYAFNSLPAATFANNAVVTLAGPGVATASAPGFVPTPSGTTTKFLRDDGTFAVPAVVTTATPGYVPTAPNISTQFLNGVGAFSTPTLTTLASTGAQGAVAGLPASNQATSFLRGDNTWQLFATLSSSILYSSLSGLPSTFAPTLHASSHISTGGDVIPLFNTGSAVSGLVPGSVTGGTANFLRADATWATPPSAGLATAGVAGLVAGLVASPTLQYLRGDDSWQLISSLSIAYSQLTSVPSTFAPSVHAATHLDNGSDPIAVVAGVRTGLVPILPAAAPTTKFLRGDATWTVIPPVSNTIPGLAPAFPNTTTTFFRGDGTYAAIPAATATVSGLVPTPPNDPTKWLRGDATFVTLPLTWNITASFTQPATSANVTGVVFTTTTALVAGMSIATVDSGNKTNYFTVSSITDGTHAVLTNLGFNGNTAAAGTVNAGIVRLDGPPVMTATGSGIVPVPPNNTTSFLRGDGVWATPASTGVSTSRVVNTQFSLTGGGDLSADRTLNLVNDTASPGTSQIYGTDTGGVRGWFASSAFPVATLSSAGLVPTLPGGTSTFLRADGTFAAPASLANASTGTAGIVVGLPATNQTSQWLRADNSWQFLPDSNVTTASWTMPAIGATVSAVTFSSTDNWDVGMTLFFATSSGITCCFMEVATVTDSTHLVLRNRGYTANPAAATVIPTSMVFVVSPGVANATMTGLVPTPPNNTTTFLRGDATFAQADFNNLLNAPAIQVSTTTTGFTQPAVGSTVNITVALSTGFAIGKGLIVPAMGYYAVTAVPDLSHVTVVNNGFLYNANPGTPSGAATLILSNVCSLFATSSAGLVPLSGGGTTNFLRADGTWSAPPGGVSAARQILTTNSITGGGDLSADRTLTLVGDTASPGNWQIYSTNGSGTRSWNTSTGFPQATATVSGLVPTPPNNTDQWLRGDATWVQAPPLAQTITATFAWPAVGGTSGSIAVDSSSNMKVGMAIYIPALGVAEVMTLPDATHMTIRNNGNTGNAGSTAGVAIGTSIYVGGAGSLATATSSGSLPTPPNNVTTFLRGDATFATPPTATATTPGYVSPPNTTTTFYRGDGTFTVIPSATSTVAGLVPTPPNNTYQFFRGDATFTQLPYCTSTNATFTVPAIGSTVSITVQSVQWTKVGQTVYISDNTNSGFFEITLVASSTGINIKNQGYLGNSISGTMALNSVVRLVGPSISTATQPGFVPLPPNNTTTYLRGDATFAAVPAATATVSGLVPTPPNNVTTFLRGDATFATPPSATATVAGYVPTPPNNTTTFLRGDATFATPPASTATVTGYVPTPPNNTFQFLNGQSAWVTPSITYARFTPYFNIPFSTTYPAFNTRGSYGLPTLDCADAVTTDCLFSDIMPQNANLGSGLTVLIRFTAHTATTGSVRWQVAFGRLNSSIATATFDTAGLVTQATNGTIDSVATATVSALTTINSIAAGDLYVVKVSRLGADGADTMADTAQLISVEVRSAGT